MVAAVGVVAAAFLRVVIHFVYKVSETGPRPARAAHRKRDWLSENPLLLQNGLIAECEQVAQGEGVTFVSDPCCFRRLARHLNPCRGLASGALVSVTASMPPTPQPVRRCIPVSARSTAFLISSFRSLQQRVESRLARRDPLPHLRDQYAPSTPSLSYPSAHAQLHFTHHQSSRYSSP